MNTNEVPVILLRANQMGIVALILLAIVTQSPIPIALLLLVEIGGLMFGLKGNLFIRIVRPLIKHRIAASSLEARELARFNNTLAVGFLVLSTLLLTLGWTLAGYIVAGVLGVVVSFAIGGYCLGCVLYYQYKLLKSHKSHQNLKGNS
ncbi:MAG: DUF4395 domain-containing protein [Dehalogenimonas sp.]